jgi:phage tail-like protein
MAAIQNAFSNLTTDPIRNFKFLVTFLGVPSGAAGSIGTTTTNPVIGTMGFVSLSGLGISTESIAYREGGYNTNVHQIPGQTSFTPITLSKGSMVGQSANADWMRRLFSVMTPSATTGLGNDFRVNLDIQVLTHPNPGVFTGSDGTQASSAVDQHTSLRFKVYNAWITSLAYSNLDAGANTLMVEELQLVHEGFDVSYATNYTAAGSAPALS